MREGGGGEGTDRGREGRGRAGEGGREERGGGERGGKAMCERSRGEGRGEIGKGGERWREVGEGERWREVGEGEGRGGKAGEGEGRGRERGGEAMCERIATLYIHIYIQNFSSYTSTKAAQLGESNPRQIQTMLINGRT